MKTWRRRVLALWMALIMVLSQATVLASDASMTELPDYGSSLYRTPYNPSQPTAGLLGGSDNTVSFDNPNPIYFVVQKSKLINTDDWRDPDNIQEGTPYQISLPDPLICYENFKDEPVWFGNQFVFARINAVKGSKTLTITFQIETDGVHLEDLQDIHISFSCSWDRERAKDMDADRNGAIDIATLPASTTVIVEELKPAPPVKPAVTKTASTDAAGVTTWTVQCTVGNEEGNIPNELVDSLPAGLEYVRDSAAVTVVPQDAASPSSVYAIYDDTEHRLICPVPRDAKEVTLKYKTTPDNTVLTKFWQDGKAPTFTNLAQATLGGNVCAQAKHSVSYKGLKPLLQKQYLDLDYDETSGAYFATWGVDVDGQGQRLEQLTLYDTYGASLLLPTSDGGIDFEKMELKITYTDPGGIPDPVIKIAEDDVTFNPDQRSITLDLQPYFFQMAGLPHQAFRVSYRLQVDKAALEQGASKDSFQNQVYGAFQTEDMTQPANSTTSTADLPVTTENTLITQTGGTYNSATRALPWTTEINPGLNAGVASPNLTSVVYEDRFTKDASNPELFGYEYQSFGLTEEAVQAQIDSITAQIQRQFEEKGLQGATVKVSIENSDTDRVLRVELTNTGRASIKFNYSTYVLKPEHWASNISDRRFRNQVRLLADGTTIDGSPIAQNAVAFAYVNVSGTVLRKWPMNSYNTADNTLDWGIEVNNRCSPLGTIQVVDVLPEGVTYVPGTARLENGPSIPDGDGDDGNYVSQNGQTLTFYLTDVKPQRYHIIYTTAVDTNAPVVTQNKTAKFPNQATLKLWSQPDNTWQTTATAAVTAKLHYSILKKTVEQKKGQESGVQEAHYAVQINPLRMQLLEPGADQLILRDKLADGLTLDVDSVTLYGGITPIAAKPPGGMQHDYRPVVNPGARIEADIHFDPVQNQLEVILPESDQPYYLTYTAYLTRAGVDLSNQVQLVNARIDDSLVRAENTVRYTTISGGASLRPPASRYCSVLLKKVAADAPSTPLSGAEFGLYSAKSEDALLAVGVSGADGICTLSVEKSKIAGLEELFYKELKAPGGYLMEGNRQWQTISMDEVAASGTNPIIVPNAKADPGQTGRLRIIRQDEETNEPLADAEITIYDGNTKVAVGTTNLRGVVEFDGLDPSKTYRIVETKPPVGYPPADEKTAQASKTPADSILENTLKPLNCTIHKTGAATGLPLSDAEFGLYQTEDCSGPPIETAITDSDGICTFPQLDASQRYWVREITPPEHYISSGTIYPLDFSKGEDIRLEIQNTRAPVTLEVTKQDENGQPLAGAKFKLTEDPDGLYVKGTGTTGANGQITFRDLTPNRSYYLWETQAPEGYQCLTDPVEIQTNLQNGGRMVRLTVSNQLAPITLTVAKVDDESKAPLSGASFRLTTDPEGLVVHDAVSCDANGVAVFYDLLPDRTYYLWETTAPAGYVRPTTCVREIHTTKQQSSIYEIIENAKIRTKLIVTKIDGDTSLPLSGAELVLSRDEAGTDVIRSLETDASGIARFEDLLPGHTYYVTERRAPAGYEKTDKVYPVTIPDGSSEPVSLTISNQRISGGSGSGGSGGKPTPRYYTLTYDLGYDARTEQETYLAGSRVPLERVPFRDGYLFTGWYEDAGCLTPVSEVSMTQNRTVYAGWERYAVSELLNAEDHFAYVIGYPDGKVHPEDHITRAQVTAAFFRLLDPEVREKNLTQDTMFADVAPDSWYRTAIATMESMGIVRGRAATEFAPDTPITRAEFAAIASRFHLGNVTPDAAFTDIAGHWAEEEIRRAATLGWVRGYSDGTFRPDQYITRAEAMTLINRMLLRLPETTEDLLPDMIRWPDNSNTQSWYYLAVQEATNSHDHARKADGVYETWTVLNPVEDWTKYERQDASAFGDISYPVPRLAP